MSAAKDLVAHFDALTEHYAELRELHRTALLNWMHEAKQHKTAGDEFQKEIIEFQKFRDSRNDLIDELVGELAKYNVKSDAVKKAREIRGT